MLATDSVSNARSQQTKAAAGDIQPTIYFNISKKELYTPSNGFKALQRRLRPGYKVAM